MKTSRLLPALFLAIVPLLSPATRAATPEVDPALCEPAYLQEVFRHLYHWYLDDRYFVETADRPDVVCYIRMLPIETDPGDHSRFAEIWFPAAALRLRVKKSDHFIEELGQQACSPTYVIISADRTLNPEADPGEYRRVLLNRAKLYEWVKAQRGAPPLLTEEVLRPLEAAVQGWLLRHAEKPVSGPQHLYFARASKVTGDIWVYWANQQVALRIAAEFGVEQPGALLHLPLQIKAYNLDTQSVASLLEQPESAAVITKGWAGRILYECMVRGFYRPWQPAPATP